MRNYITLYKPILPGRVAK